MAPAIGAGGSYNAKQRSMRVSCGVAAAGVLRRWWAVSATALALQAVAVPLAWPYDARLTFLPIKHADSYSLQIQFDDEGWQDAVDLGALAPYEDGEIRIVVENLPLGPTIRFAVRAQRKGFVSKRSNYGEISYASVASLIDTDGDGLHDADEDTDLDRQVDPGESDPDVADTDGDGVSDGAEVAAGTDPTIPDTPPESSCGDGVVGGDEQCDDGNQSNSDGCLNHCALARCGDRIVYEGVEECDDGNDLNGDGCLTDCRQAVCGDGFVHRGSEQCDEGAENSDIADGACRTNCTFPECSPGDPDGVCDDDNICTYEICAGGNCDHEFTVDKCDDGVPCTADDTCAGGACVGRDTCEGGDVCNFDTGECQHQAHADSGIWLPAAMYPAAEFGGSLTTGTRFAAGDDADPDADSISPMLVYADPGAGTDGDATVYWINLPSSGPWYLWGRFYYPGVSGGNDANSFYLAVDDSEPIPFGNNDLFQRWHWDGDGVEFGQTPLELGYLDAGPHRLLISKRETKPDAPRLDVLFLTPERTAMPSDEVASEALAHCPFGGCEDDVCGDANANRVLSLADAWMILNAAIGSGGYCRLSACDVNGDGVIQTWDAIAVMHAMTGSVESNVLNCRPSVAFGISNANSVDRISFLVDYSNSGVAFTNKFGHVRCRHADSLAVSRFEATDDPLKQVLNVVMELDEPVSGSSGLAECFVRPPESGQLPGPGAYIVVATGLHGAGDGPISASVAVIPGG